MPDNDITKMKVADLKRELKIRGLVTTGNKTELQDRLQTALIDGELLEDTAIMSGDELLTDEDEEKILGGDENELLKSPITIPTASELGVPTRNLTIAGSHVDDDILESPTSASAPPLTIKKIVLKRKNSFITTTTTEGITKITPTDDLSTNKLPKMSERNPITMDATGNNNIANAAPAKLTQLSLQERLEMRAKKFGTQSENSIKKDFGSLDTLSASNSSGTPSSDQQIDLLKKRAERFGCVVSSKIAKIDADEKLLKRKERFGGNVTSTTGTTTTVVAAGNSDIWAEKARQRLERFKTNSPATGKGSSNGTSATGATTIVGN